MGDPPSVIVDGHAHVWTLDTTTYPWQPTFGFVPTKAALPQDLLRSMDSHAVAYAVLVQPSASGSLLETVRAHPTRFVAIGLVDPADSVDTEHAAQLVADEGCVGLRVNLSLDPERAAHQARGAGWARLETLGVPICVRATPMHRELVTMIVARNRGMRIVIDHLGLPNPRRPREAADVLTQLAGFDHLRAALKAFGPSRLAWGSDFPDGGSEQYGAAIRAIESMPFLSAAARTQLMTQTSHDLWGSPIT
jgi:predicted TIM-barrel fold metal-dependent hydrolase